jgi:tricorn protease
MSESVRSCAIAAACLVLGALALTGVTRDAYAAAGATAGTAAEGAASADTTAPAANDATLARYPTLHGDRIVFEAHGNLWEVARGGGAATRLTAEAGTDLMPRFSPDGRWIAFTGDYQGNRDVYVIPAGGGHARRLTFWSDVVSDAPLRWGPNNMVVTWTPDSRNIVFLSRRDSWNSWYGRLFEVGLSGGLPQLLPLDRGGLMSYGPDGHRIAYNRIFRNYRTWKRYDGGLAQDIYIYDFTTQQLQRVTDWKGTDTAPMWYRNTIYFLSDRDRARRENIWAYDLSTRQFREVTHFTDYDIDFPSLGDSGIVFQQGGSLYVLDLPSERLHRLSISVPDDGLRTGVRYVDASKYIRDPDMAQITDYDLAPNGKRVLFCARGDLFSLPAQHGDTRNLTQTSGADEDHPAWSPDGRQVAYTTDDSGEQQIAVRPAEGGAERLLTHFPRGYLYQPVWAPGGDRLAFSDSSHRLWYVGLAGGAPVSVAQDRYQEIHDYAWSPDGRWLAYSVTADNQQSQIWLYELAMHRATRVSDGRSSDHEPVFGPAGKYLYFVSDRHENPVLSETEFDVADLRTSGIYVVTLQGGTPSPFAPQSDEGSFQENPHTTGAAAQGGSAAAARASGSGVPAAGASGAWHPGASAPVRIDLPGLMARAVPVPIPAASIGTLAVRGHFLYYQTLALQTLDGPLGGQKGALHGYDLQQRRDSVLIGALDSYAISFDGSKVLYRRDAGGKKAFYIADARPSAAAPASAASSGEDASSGDGGNDGSSGESASAGKALDLSHMQMRVEPRQEWNEMFQSAWRLERDLFFRPQMNGVDWDGVRRSYQRLLPLLGSRDDLNFLIGELIGELSNSHTYVGGGDRGGVEPRVPTAYLGVDYGIDAKAGHYVFSRIYPGDNTRPEYHSSLTEPGIDVRAGDELLAIDGQNVALNRDPESFLVGKQQQTVRLTVERPGGKPHDVVVQPLNDELMLRSRAWIDHNREVVDKASNGRIAYIYLTDMEELGMEQFIRQFYPQLDRQALIVDDRWNGGGEVDEIVLERIRRMLVGMSTDREAAAETVPQQLISGPKVCLINQYSASDGDLFPYFFKQYGLGPLIGMRTWGGVRGIRGYWSLLDDGYITIPEDAVYGLNSHWVIENHGVEPDMMIEDTPGQLQAGTDAQLNAAVAYLLRELKQRPGTLPPAPPGLPAYPAGNR